MNYSQTLQFLYSSLPMYHRIGLAAIRKDLTNIRRLCTILGEPQQAFPSIHIAGTNGKGSTSHMLASVFQSAGKRVGLYTSPHYMDFRERIKVNGTMVPKKDVIRFVEKYRSQWETIHPSFFEITVAMAFDYFRNKNVDIAIIETGLGGRLDSTNIITPLLAVITNIGLDHTQMLGNTLKEIAGEKAGIIKSGIPVVIGEWQKETREVFKSRALKLKAPIHFASKHIRLHRGKNTATTQVYHVKMPAGFLPERIESDLQGPYQLNNIRTVLEAVWCWNKYYPVHEISVQHVRDGLSAVKSKTGIMGRWMIIQDKPRVITDAAHNAHGMQTIIPELLSIKARQRHFVLGFVSDKDISTLLHLFPENGIYYWCSPDIPRGRDVTETQMAGMNHGLVGLPYRSVLQAFKAALKAAGPSDLIFVGGSSYVVGDFLSGIRYNQK